MPDFSRRTRAAALALAAATLAGCGSFDRNRLAGFVTPYRPEVVQGNFISREQVDALKPGMSRQQVREVLGTPLVTSLFHADRWDYVFTLRRQGLENQQRKLTVFFKGDQFEKAEGDTMPTEAEFVTTLDNRRKAGKVPQLQATEEQLRAAGGRAAASPAPAAPATPALPPPGTYPPLEAPAR